MSCFTHDVFTQRNLPTLNLNFLNRIGDARTNLPGQGRLELEERIVEQLFVRKPLTAQMLDDFIHFLIPYDVSGDANLRDVCVGPLQFQNDRMLLTDEYWLSFISSYIPSHTQSPYIGESPYIVELETEVALRERKRPICLDLNLARPHCRTPSLAPTFGS